MYSGYLDNIVLIFADLIAVADVCVVLELLNNINVLISSIIMSSLHNDSVICHCRLEDGFTVKRVKISAIEVLLEAIFNSVSKIDGNDKINSCLMKILHSCCEISCNMKLLSVNDRKANIDSSLCKSIKPIEGLLSPIMVIICSYGLLSSSNSHSSDDDQVIGLKRKYLDRNAVNSIINTDNIGEVFEELLETILKYEHHIYNNHHLYNCIHVHCCCCVGLCCSYLSTSRQKLKNYYVT